MELLKKAKSFKPLRKQKTHNYGKEDQELAIAWLKDEITASQICYALGKKDGKSDSRFYSFLAIALKEAYREGSIKILK